MTDEPEELAADPYALAVSETGWDLLFDWQGSQQHCTIYDAGGNRLYDCEMRNETTKPGQYGFQGPCPPGNFVLAASHSVGIVSMGAYFIPLLDLDEEGPMHANGRHGIGIHGGGTGLEEPFADEQGWVKTHGCFRVQNQALEMLVSMLHDCHSKSGQAFIHVNPG